MKPRKKIQIQTEELDLIALTAREPERRKTMTGARMF